MLNILHISDTHIQEKDQKDISDISQKLIADVLRVQEEQHIKIDLVCFTGDLIQSGCNAVSGENQMSIANKILVQPLLSALELQKAQFIFVPGNHEVDTSKIVRATENGLQAKTLSEINENIAEMNSEYLKRLAYFYDKLNDYYDDVIRNKIGYAFKREIDKKKIGIVCIDSAWRSSGKGACEKGILYVGTKQIEDLYEQVEDCDFKICMMHHPVDWLSDCEMRYVERELSKFDIVLRGHVHENETKEVCFHKVKTIYSTAGKLYPLDYSCGRAIDGYNGYSIINIDFSTRVCTIFIRSYFAKDRKEFDCGIDIVSEGKIEYPLNGNTVEKQAEFNIVEGIKQYFEHMSEKFLLIKRFDKYSPTTLDQVFVEPILSDESEYVKESSDGGKSINLDDIIERNSENIIFLGKKETGKTSLLQRVGLIYINKYENYNLIPIYIDMRQLPKKSDKLMNASIYFVLENMLDDAYISKEKVRKLVASGKFVFLIDNIDINDSVQIDMIQQFISHNSLNRFFLAIKEDFFQSLNIKRIPNFGQNFKKVYIHYFGKAQIRQLVTSWAKPREDTNGIRDIVEKIDQYCNQINFAKTPFNISIFMVLWDEDKNFVPQNEGIVMRRYLEIVLEKLSASESNRKTYAFNIKQHYLSNLAYIMFEKGKYYLSEQEFEDFTHEYHKKKGYRESDSRFLEIFFEKGILGKSEEWVYFSHTSILEYYLAIYAKNNKDFLNFMLKKGNRIFFYNEICFLSGLINDCRDLLNELSHTIQENIRESIDIIDGLNEYEIMTAFKIKKEELLQSLNVSRPTQDDLDHISDMSNKKEELTPIELSKKRQPLVPSYIVNLEDKKTDVESQEVETEDFFSLVQMYGCVLKNAELLDNKDKIKHLEIYMYAMNILLGEILHVTEQIKEELTFDDVKNDIEDLKEIPSEEEFEKMKSTVLDMAKVSIPIAIQNVILENVGTPKLEMAINELLKEKDNKPFEKFMLIFLKCDLKIGSFQGMLGNYIKNENSESILKLILMKLIYYYRMRVFGVNITMDNVILDLICDTQRKLNPKESRKLSMCYAKGDKKNARKYLAQQLDREEGA